LGNLNHPHDQKRILESENRQLIAEWLFQGLLEANQ